ncbi:MAG: trypsin-like serine protease, partial [Myxococcota bacterium]
GAGQLCTGTLIAPNLVLTARHCVAQASGCGRFGADFAIEGFLIVFAKDLAEPDSPDHIREVAEVLVHDGDRVCGDDMALLILSSNVPETVATPATPRVRVPAASDERYTALGYGDTNDRDAQPFLLRVLEDRVVECYGSACGSSQVRSTEFFGDDGACRGDSGGPALDTQGRVIGVASRVLGGGCRDVVYSDVSSFRALLLEAAARASMLGGYSLPEWASAESTPSDRDGDGVADTEDVCPSVADSEQLDFDADGLGDLCDPTPFGEESPDMGLPLPGLDMGAGLVDGLEPSEPMEPEVFMLQGEVCSLTGVPQRAPAGSWMLVFGLITSLALRRSEHDFGCRGSANG